MGRGALVNVSVLFLSETLAGSEKGLLCKIIEIIGAQLTVS